MYCSTMLRSPRTPKPSAIHHIVFDETLQPWKVDLVAHGMRAAALPVRGGELLHEGERLLAAPAEGARRLARVVAQVLPLLRPAVGIGRGDRRIVRGEDRVEPRLEQLLRVAEVADDFLGRPVLGVGPPRERGVALAADRARQLVGGALEALQALLARLLGVLLHGRHRAPPQIGDQLVKEARLALVEALRMI